MTQICSRVHQNARNMTSWKFFFKAPWTPPPPLPRVRAWIPSTPLRVSANPSENSCKHFSFQRFLHLRNLQKLIKTGKPGNLETYVQIPGNLSLTPLSDKWWKPKKPIKNHRKLMKWAIYNQVHSAGFLGFRFPSFWKLENQWKPVMRKVVR